MYYDILVEARKSLDERGWTKFVSHSADGRGCALQHIQWGCQATGVDMVPTYKVARFIMHVNGMGGDSIAFHNDRSATTIYDVRRWFDKAIEAAKPVVVIDAHNFELGDGAEGHR